MGWYDGVTMKVRVKKLVMFVLLYNSISSAFVGDKGVLRECS